MHAAEAIRLMRSDPRYAGLVAESYWDVDTLAAARRFEASAEFEESVQELGVPIAGKRVLDLGAGTGIASYALALRVAAHTVAIEPDLSDEAGTGALQGIRGSLPISAVAAVGEGLPFAEGTFDVVYGRQVLHHAGDLERMLAECYRILRPGGFLFASREHVVDDERQLQQFLARHPVHQLTGGEAAYSLERYTSAMVSAGLELEKVVEPWDSVINTYPTFCSSSELERAPEITLGRRLGRIGALLARVPPARAAARWYLRRPVAGRAYSFLAVKRA